MKHFLTLTIALPLLLALALACDSPDDEAELLALDIEDDVKDQDNQEIKDGKPAFEELDLEANETPAAAPPGKCCKAKCSWDPYNWPVAG